jgi:nucleoside-diphosphate-sugar epimerase
MECRPGQSPYSASKIGADQIALSYFRSFETPVTIVRPFNTYDPRQSERAVIPTVITQLAAGNDEIRLESLSPTRDFSYVADTVAGFIAFAECDEALGEIVNLSSGFEFSIGDTVKLIMKLMNRNVTILSDEYRMLPEKSEVNRLFPDMSKARSISKWRPEYGGIDEFERGLAETIEWFTSSGNLENYKHDIYKI